MDPFQTPEGHIHVHDFLCVPILYGEDAIGLISVGNKKGGYTEEDQGVAGARCLQSFTHPACQITKRHPGTGAHGGGEGT